jgi:RNA polymerase sigma-70 factor (ECF subfamily)
MNERARLINLAYRLLGSVAEAEDAVQETYTRWYSLSSEEQARVNAPRAWLTTVTSRICLDVLRSARVRRENYVGQWIPEPVRDHREWSDSSQKVPVDPVDRITLDESIDMAFMVLLDSMTPAERVAFLLHDIFRYPFTEVAEIVGRTPAACRQLAVSARRRISRARRPAAPPSQHAGIIRQFKQAWEAMDIDTLVALLDPDATAIADGGGLAITFPDPIEGGQQIALAWLEIARRRPPNMAILERTVNGRPGLVALQDGITVSVFAFDVVDDRIQHIWVVRNPEKLSRWTAN